MPKDFKVWSRENWQRTDEVKPTTEQLTLGCLQRIADSLEAMAKPYIRLLEDHKYYVEKDARQEAQIKRLKNRATGLKAANTKLKNKNKLPLDQQHLRTCGTQYPGCAPNCPKELAERVDEGN